jgi:uncharacterized protein (TIGR02145 family)
MSEGAYCEYNNDPSNVETYGLFYNFYAVADARNIAPEGWHVPSDGEWTTLVNYLGGNPGGKLKEAGYDHWNPPNDGATNETGFTALPAGVRHYSNASYGGMGGNTYFWSTYTTHYLYGYCRGLGTSHTMVTRESIDKHYGISLRCVKD